MYKKENLVLLYIIMITFLIFEILMDIFFLKLEYICELEVCSYNGMHPIYKGVSETVDYVDKIITIPYENNGRVVKDYKFIVDKYDRICYIVVEWENLSSNRVGVIDKYLVKEEENTLMDIIVCVAVGGTLMFLIAYYSF